MLSRFFRTLGCLAAIGAFVSGCGGGDNKPTAAVKGKVTLNGTAVNGGEVIFTPIGGTSDKAPGQAGRGLVDASGNFKLSTYGTDDGAVIGKHRVMFMPKAPEAAPHEQEGEPQPKPTLVPTKETVEVAKGDNTIDIELVEQPPKP